MWKLFLDVALTVIGEGAIGEKKRVLMERVQSCKESSLWKSREKAG